MIYENIDKATNFEKIDFIISDFPLNIFTYM